MEKLLPQLPTPSRQDNFDKFSMRILHIAFQLKRSKQMQADRLSCSGLRRLLLRRSQKKKKNKKIGGKTNLLFTKVNTKRTGSWLTAVRAHQVFGPCDYAYLRERHVPRHSRVHAGHVTRLLLPPQSDLCHSYPDVRPLNGFINTYIHTY